MIFVFPKFWFQCVDQERLGVLCLSGRLPRHTGSVTGFSVPVSSAKVCSMRKCAKVYHSVYHSVPHWVQCHATLDRWPVDKRAQIPDHFISNWVAMNMCMCSWPLNIQSRGAAHAQCANVHAHVSTSYKSHKCASCTNTRPLQWTCAFAEMCRFVQYWVVNHLMQMYKWIALECTKASNYFIFCKLCCWHIYAHILK